MKKLPVLIVAALAGGLSFSATAQPATAAVPAASVAPAASVQGAPVVRTVHRHRHHRRHHIRHHRRHLYRHHVIVPAERARLHREVRRGNTPDLYDQAGTRTQSGIGANEHQKSGD